ncbi:hypothetical protein B0H13DRAFT_1902021 [Mycena leptocephala]|nr:hypothetical protein B0H13DRAFT_1902021 [Mycena leptocephala]
MPALSRQFGIPESRPDEEQIRWPRESVRMREYSSRGLAGVFGAPTLPVAALSVAGEKKMFIAAEARPWTRRWHRTDQRRSEVTVARRSGLELGLTLECIGLSVHNYLGQRAADISTHLKVLATGLETPYPLNLLSVSTQKNSGLRSPRCNLVNFEGDFSQPLVRYRDPVQAQQYISQGWFSGPGITSATPVRQNFWVEGQDSALNNAILQSFKHLSKDWFALFSVGRLVPRTTVGSLSNFFKSETIGKRTPQTTNAMKQS